eukprot:766874-Hanusia_phi.AAC.1
MGFTAFPQATSLMTLTSPIPSHPYPSTPVQETVFLKHPESGPPSLSPFRLCPFGEGRVVTEVQYAGNVNLPLSHGWGPI